MPSPRVGASAVAKPAPRRSPMATSTAQPAAAPQRRSPPSNLRRSPIVTAAAAAGARHKADAAADPDTMGVAGAVVGKENASIAAAAAVAGKSTTGARGMHGDGAAMPHSTAATQDGSPEPEAATSPPSPAHDHRPVKLIGQDSTIARAGHNGSLISPPSSPDADAGAGKAGQPGGDPAVKPSDTDLMPPPPPKIGGSKAHEGGRAIKSGTSKKSSGATGASKTVRTTASSLPRRRSIGGKALRVAKKGHTAARHAASARGNASMRQEATRASTATSSTDPTSEPRSAGRASRALAAATSASGAVMPVAIGVTDPQSTPIAAGTTIAVAFSDSSFGTEDDDGEFEVDSGALASILNNTGIKDDDVDFGAAGGGTASSAATAIPATPQAGRDRRQTIGVSSAAHTPAAQQSSGDVSATQQKKWRRVSVHSPSTVAKAAPSRIGRIGPATATKATKPARKTTQVAAAAASKGKGKDSTGAGGKTGSTSSRRAKAAKGTRPGSVSTASDRRVAAARGSGSGMSATAGGGGDASVAMTPAAASAKSGGGIGEEFGTPGATPDSGSRWRPLPPPPPPGSNPSPQELKRLKQRQQRLGRTRAAGGAAHDAAASSPQDKDGAAGQSPAERELTPSAVRAIEDDKEFLASGLDASTLGDDVFADLDVSFAGGAGAAFAELAAAMADEKVAGNESHTSSGTDRVAPNKSNPDAVDPVAAKLDFGVRGATPAADGRRVARRPAGATPRTSTGGAKAVVPTHAIKGGDASSTARKNGSNKPASSGTSRNMRRMSIGGYPASVNRSRIASTPGTSRRAGGGGAGGTAGASMTPAQHRRATERAQQEVATLRARLQVAESDASRARDAAARAEGERSRHRAATAEQNRKIAGLERDLKRARKDLQAEANKLRHKDVTIAELRKQLLELKLAPSAPVCHSCGAVVAGSAGPGATADTAVVDGDGIARATETGDGSGDTHGADDGAAGGGDKDKVPRNSVAAAVAGAPSVLGRVVHSPPPPPAATVVAAAAPAAADETPTPAAVAAAATADASASSVSPPPMPSPGTAAPTSSNQHSLSTPVAAAPTRGGKRRKSTDSAPGTGGKRDGSAGRKGVRSGKSGGKGKARGKGTRAGGVSVTPGTGPRAGRRGSNSSTGSGGGRVPVGGDSAAKRSLRTPIAQAGASGASNNRGKVRHSTPRVRQAALASPMPADAAGAADGASDAASNALALATASATANGTAAAAADGVAAAEGQMAQASARRYPDMGALLAPGSGATAAVPNVTG